MTNLGKFKLKTLEQFAISFCADFRFGPLNIAMLVSLCLIGLAGCSGSDPFPGEEGKVLHIASAANVKGFDTTQVGDTYSHKAQALVYEELLQFNYLERPFQVEPCLAESMPEVSEDGLTYTFKIRRGVKFHDDVCFDPAHERPATRELVAGDFVYSFKRIADAKNTSTGWGLLDGRIDGLIERISRLEAGAGGSLPSVWPPKMRPAVIGGSVVTSLSL